MGHPASIRRLFAGLARLVLDALAASLATRDLIPVDSARESAFLVRRARTGKGTAIGCRGRLRSSVDMLRPLPGCAPPHLCLDALPDSRNRFASRVASDATGVAAPICDWH